MNAESLRRLATNLIDEGLVDDEADAMWAALLIASAAEACEPRSHEA